MNPYLVAFALGALGLLVMAASGLGRHGADGHSGHDAHAGHGAHHTHHPGDAAHHHHHHEGPAHALLALASPRVLFSVLLGAGAAGLLLGRAFGGPLLLLAAVLGGVLLERLAVAPVWRAVDRFASAPARTLETALYDRARAASRFDANGEGLVAIELDGQVVQLLGRLAPGERGLQVRAGDALRVEDVDAERHRCTVSLARDGARTPA